MVSEERLQLELQKVRNFGGAANVEMKMLGSIIRELQQYRAVGTVEDVEYYQSVVNSLRLGVDIAEEDLNSQKFPMEPILLALFKDWSENIKIN